MHMLHVGIFLSVVVMAGALVMIAVLIHRNTRAVKHSGINLMRSQFMGFQIAVARDEALADLFYRGLHAVESLDKIEQVRFFNLAAYVMGFWSEGYIYEQEGALPADYWNAIHRAMLDTSQYPGFREYWSQRRHWYSESFQRYVDATISSANMARPMYRKPQEA